MKLEARCVASVKGLSWAKAHAANIILETFLNLTAAAPCSNDRPAADAYAEDYTVGVHLVKKAHVQQLRTCLAVKAVYFVHSL